MSAAGGPAASQARASETGFRGDINGLRAISIALVIAFHLSPSAVPGGFIGVDVFFVISGYLMTRIILGRLDQGRFKLGEFYLARLRRIWPALVALCAVLAVLGAVCLDPWSYERLADDIPATLLFLSNFAFGLRIGYFAPGDADTWLLHTWSLAVEWQFYLIYPLMLMAISAVPALKRRLWTVIAMVAALSLALALFLWTRSSQWSFYLLTSRAWELLAGALCVAAEARLRLAGAWRLVGHVLGLGLIGAGALLADPSPGWPSATALLPVGGAALVIAAAAPRSLWADNPAVGLVGRASYSIYIWHWPLIVAMRYFQVPRTPLIDVLAVGAMLGLGFISYWLVERRLTAWLFAPRPWRWGVGAAVAAGAGALAAAAMLSHGFEAIRTAGLSPAVRAALADDRAAQGDWAFPAACGRMVNEGRLHLCQMGDPAARQVLVIGDSNADQFAPRYAHAFDATPGAGLTLLTHEGCVPIPGMGRPGGGGVCARWEDAAFQWAETAGFKRLVIISSWSNYFDPLPGEAAATLCLADGRRCRPAPPGAAALREAAFTKLEAALARLRRRGIEVVVFGPAPGNAAADPLLRYRRAFWSADPTPLPFRRADFLARAGPIRDRVARAAQASGAILVDQLDALCPTAECPVADDGGRALYKDAGHFRAAAVSGALFAYLDPWLAPALAQPAKGFVVWGGPARIPWTGA